MKQNGVCVRTDKAVHQAATKADQPAGAVARWVTQLRETLYQRKHGTHEERRAQMLETIAGLAGGQALLAKAESLGTPVYVRHPRAMKGNHGYALPPEADKPPEVYVANNGHTPGMALTGLHELRHVSQFADPCYKEHNDTKAVARARAVFITRMMAEADACTVETLAAVKQQAAGDNSFMEDLQKRTTPVYRCIRQFLHENPYEGFKSDAAFCRSLFTELMISGLDHYRYDFLHQQSIAFRAGQTLEAFNEITTGKTASATAAPVDDFLGRTYGAGFTTATSMRALQTAFFAALPPREQEVLTQMEKTAVRAAKGKLTQEQFAAARGEILAKVKDIYFTEDEDAAFYKWMVKDSAVHKTLRDAAREDKPVPLKAVLRAAGAPT